MCIGIEIDCKFVSSVGSIMRITTFFILRTKQIYSKLLTISGSTLKIKIMLQGTPIETMFMYAAICKQSLLH